MSDSKFPDIVRQWTLYRAEDNHEKLLSLLSEDCVITDLNGKTHVGQKQAAEYLKANPASATPGDFKSSGERTGELTLYMAGLEVATCMFQGNEKMQIEWIKVTHKGLGVLAGWFQSLKKK